MALEAGDLPGGRVPEEVEGADHPWKLLAVHIEPHLLVGPDCQVDGLEAALLELGQRDVLSDPHAGLDLHTEARDALDLVLDHVAGQPEGGDACHEHAPRFLHRIEDGDRVPLEGEEVGGRQAGRARTDDCHGIVGPNGLALLHRGLLLGLPVREEALQVLDRQGSIDVAAPAVALAGMGADVAAHGREGVVLPNQIERLLEPAERDECHVAGHVDPRRAAALAGGRREGRTGQARALAMVDVCLVLVPEVPQSAEHRVWSGCTQPA